MPSVESLLLEGARLLAFVMLIVAPVPLVAHLLHRRHVAIASPHSVTHDLLAGLVVWTVLECTVVSSLGWAGFLRPGLLLFVAAGLLGSGLLFTARAGPARRSWWDLALGPAQLLSRSGRLDRLMILLVASTACLLAAQLLMFPVTDIDSLSYQLPRVVQWYQSGHFHDPMPQLGSLINSYPFTWNTLFLLAAAPMGQDQFILFFNIVAWLMFGLVIYRLARLCGGEQTVSLSVATLALVMPVSVRLVRTARIDLAFAAFFLASVYFLLHAHLRRDRASAAIGVACGGMMLGTKMSGVPYALLLAWIIHERVRRVRCAPSPCPSPPPGARGSSRLPLPRRGRGSG
jgi:hypothetical protein